MLETAGKVLDFIAKKSWATFFLALFVLFSPDRIAGKIGISDLRETYKGFWGVLLILSGVLLAGVISSSVYRYYVKWKKKVNDLETAEKQKEEKLIAISSRLDSLSDEEKLWIQYCLYYNTQTFSAQQVDTVAQSLTYKRILNQGSGSILDLPFHIPDYIWLYLKDNESIYLPDELRNNPKFPQVLKAFRDRRKFSGY